MNNLQPLPTMTDLAQAAPAPQRKVEDDFLTKSVKALTEPDIILGIVIQNREEMVASTSLLPEKRVATICQTLHELHGAYKKTQRNINDCLIAFDSCQIMVVADGDLCIWAMLKRELVGLDTLKSELRENLKSLKPLVLAKSQQSKRSKKKELSPEWPKYEEIALHLLSKAVGETEAKSLIKNYFEKCAKPELGEEAAAVISMLKSSPIMSRTLISKFEEINSLTVYK